jgi:hypothetical protein
MCYDWEIRKLVEMQETARRAREKEAQKREQSNVAPPKPAEPAPGPRNKEPVPA